MVNLNNCHDLQYFDAVGWVFWPVKPTIESENGLQLDSLSTSVNINRLSMVDSMSAVGNDSRPWVVPQLIKWLSTITRGRDGSLWIQSLVESNQSSGHLCPPTPHIGSAWWDRHDNNNKLSRYLHIMEEMCVCLSSHSASRAFPAAWKHALTPCWPPWALMV